MSIRVKIVSPLPPPAGGIARWTRLVTEYAQSQSIVQLSVLNTALRWRSVMQTATSARIAAGVPQIIRCVGELARDLLGRRIDVLHINSSGQLGLIRDLTLAVLGQIFRVPVVVHLRFGRVPEVFRSGGYERRLLHALFARANAVIALDKKTEIAVRRRLPHLPITVIPNCIMASKLAHKNDEVLGEYVLFAGWVTPEKGVEELIAAWRQLPERGWTLVLAGAFDPAYLVSLGLSPGRNGSVEVLGEVKHDRLLNLMAGCEIFTLPSHTEGFPNAVLEAMSLGRPVVACDVGAVGDMLSEDCGVIVPARDEGELRRAISDLIDCAARRHALGANAAIRVRSRYSISAVFEQYKEVWRSASGDGE